MSYSPLGVSNLSKRVRFMPMVRAIRIFVHYPLKLDTRYIRVCHTHTHIYTTFLKKHYLSYPAREHFGTSMQNAFSHFPLPPPPPLVNRFL